MTAQLLTSELSTLLQESKRKNPELRAATEKSLNELNALPRTSEAQITADLRARPNFVTPFLIACSTKNPKFAGNAVACLQRLIVANALSNAALGNVLEALRETSSLALDIQLKVLQALPSLLQNYGDDLTGPLLIAAFQVCFQLHANKTAVVTNLAAAALRQLIDSTFERAASTQNVGSEDSVESEVSVGNDTITIQGSRLDAYRIFDDVCLITEGHRPKYIQGASLAQIFGLELIESTLSNHVATIQKWPEQIHLLRIRLMPLITRVLSEKASFSATVRCMRLVELTLRNLLDQLTTDCEVILSLLNHMLDPDAAPQWKRASCLEIFRNLHSNPSLIRQIYTKFDEEEERRNVVRDHLGGLVRLASEKPALIGLGQHSSVPTYSVDDSGEQAALQAGGLVGSIGVSVSGVDVNTPGISNRWSNLKTPCLEQLDKPEPAPIPATYIYKLVLTCLTSFEEGIARFLFPFTVPKDKKVKRRQLKMDDSAQQATSADGEPTGEEDPKPRKSKIHINPLTLHGHSLYDEIAVSAQMVDQCWPALLATSSTFFNASMDSENFHLLIRSFQKFTQIAGLLDLATPRDAFLTTLGKYASPASKAVRAAPAPAFNGHDDFTNDSADEASRDSSPAPTTPSIRPPVKRQHTLELTIPILTSRHLLCLRALLNLGIALGPRLHGSWSILLETLQQADLLMSASSALNQRPRSRDGPEHNAERGEEFEDLGLEIKAAESAAARLFEGTREFDNISFKEVLQCLCNLLHDDDSPGVPQTPSSSTLSPMSATRKHQKLRSISGMTLGDSAASHDGVFVIEKLKQVIQCNVSRLVQTDTAQNGWNMLYDNLLAALASPNNHRNVRLGAAAVFNNMMIMTAIFDGKESDERLGRVRARSLNAILSEVTSLHLHKGLQFKSSKHDELDIHGMAFDALRSILDQCGDSLETGWTDVFRIILSAFQQRTASHDDDSGDIELRSPALVRASFGSIELICSDFLSSVPSSCLLQLLDTLYRFAAQRYDLNISLTTSTFFQTISDYILREERSLHIEHVSLEAFSEPAAQMIPEMNKGTDAQTLWLLLLKYMVKLTTDPRLEARHNTVHTVFRILSAQADRMSEQSTSNIYVVLIQPMINDNQLAFISASKSNDEKGKANAFEWNKTTVLVLEGVGKLFAHWIDAFKAEEMILGILRDLLDRLEHSLRRKVLIVSKAAFGGISRIFAEMDERPRIDSPQLVKVWKLWNDFTPVDHSGNNDPTEDNNDALLAHLFCLGQLLRLSGQTLRQDHAEMVAAQLLTSIKRASASAYSSDVDTMTPVQKATVESIKMLPRISNDYDLKLIKLIKNLANLAYSPREDEQPPHASYVALSKSSMMLLESFISNRIRDRNVDSDSQLPANALSALQQPLHLKYEWFPAGREPSTWKKATSTAVSVIQSSAQVIDKSSSAGQALWSEAIKIADAITSADCSACRNPSNIRQDEDFDIDAFNSAKSLITSALGSEALSDGLRRQFCVSLFQNSLVHEPHPDDLALPGQPLLSGLQSDHFGQVKDLPPSKRSRLCYMLFDELFALVSEGSEGNNEGRNRLAKAAAPYLILRCGITLKTYVFDQPLRGYMPLPHSQRKEMEYVLRKIAELRVDPSALEGLVGAEATGDESQARKDVARGNRWHLIRLYSLLLRALKAARRDEQMAKVLQGVLEDVASAWKM